VVSAPQARALTLPPSEGADAEADDQRLGNKRDRESDDCGREKPCALRRYFPPVDVKVIRKK
jgi:hypothetical protein